MKIHQQPRPQGLWGLGRVDCRLGIHDVSGDDFCETAGVRKCRLHVFMHFKNGGDFELEMLEVFASP